MMCFEVVMEKFPGETLQLEFFVVAPNMRAAQWVAEQVLEKADEIKVRRRNIKSIRAAHAVEMVWEKPANG